MTVMGHGVHTSFSLAGLIFLSVPLQAQAPELSAGSAPSDTSRRTMRVLSRSTLSEEDRILALSRLWSEARFSFAYFDRMSLDWDSLYQAFIPRVRTAATDYEHYLELMRFFAHLRDGHSGVFWPREFNEALGYPPLEIRKIEGRPVIFRVLKRTEEVDRLGIRPGLAIQRVDDRLVEELVSYWRTLKTGSTEQATERLAHFRILTGPRGSTVDVVVQEPDGTTRTVSLTRSEEYFNDTNLTPTRLYSRRELLVGGVGYFRADQMAGSVAEAFAEYIEAAGAQMRGLVLDLRYNGGGSDRNSLDMVSRLIRESVNAPIHEVTEYRADRRAFREEQERVRTPAGVVRPSRGARFTGELIVLIGEQTHSAAEGGFLSVVRGRPRTRFVGEPTAGSTGQPLLFRLPGGGLGAVCSRRTLGPDGSTFVGVGFQPDVRLSPTQEDLFLERDPVLEWALSALGAGQSDLGR